MTKVEISKLKKAYMVTSNEYFSCCIEEVYLRWNKVKNHWEYCRASRIDLDPDVKITDDIWNFAGYKKELPFNDGDFYYFDHTEKNRVFLENLKKIEVPGAFSKKKVLDNLVSGKV